MPSETFDYDDPAVHAKLAELRKQGFREIIPPEYILRPGEMREQILAGEELVHLVEWEDFNPTESNPFPGQYGGKTLADWKCMLEQLNYRDQQELYWIGKKMAGDYLLKAIIDRSE